MTTNPAKVLCFKHGSIRWKGPGQQRDKTGFVYALFWDNQVKVGATRNPRMRVSLSGYDELEKTAVVVPLSDYKLREKQFHQTMQPISLLHGVRWGKEIYPITDSKVRSAILNWIKEFASDEALDRLQRVVGRYYYRNRHLREETGA